jgi:hypothetical protein
MKQKLSSVLLAVPLLVAAQGDPAGACYNEIWKHPAMEPLGAKVNSTDEGAAIKLRASTQKANAKEKKALEFWLDELLKCQKIANDFREKNYHPEAQAILRAFDLDVTNNLTRFYAGRISWGEFIEGRDKAVNDMKDKGAAFNAKMQAQQEAQAKQDAEANALAEQRRQAGLREDFERQQQQGALVEAQRQARIQQEQANSRQQMMNGLMLLEAARPKPSPMPAPSSSTFCTTRRGAYNTLETVCR